MGSSYIFPSVSWWRLKIWHIHQLSLISKKVGIKLFQTGSKRGVQLFILAYSTVEKTVQYSYWQYSTVTDSTVQYSNSTVQYCTVRYSTVERSKFKEVKFGTQLQPCFLYKQTVCFWCTQIVYVLQTLLVDSSCRYLLKKGFLKM